ncbi:zinc-finger domain-containing protein [Paracoccus salsus]|uniref:zinc-finger domain-containing protein n=1 Tax=Paracoccus salsus TaxID=2911061 RepID=UPI003F6E0D63
MTQHVTPENPLSTEQGPESSRLPAPEEFVVTTWRVACDGDDAAGLGHPRVWLAISPASGFVDCGYCDKRFVIDRDHVAGDH